MKARNVILFILFLVLCDQILKIYIKTNYYYGEEHKMLGMDWFRFLFIENKGFAWGLTLGSEKWAQIALSTLRLFAVIALSYYLKYIIQKAYHSGFIISIALIYAGALGNLLNGMFYGLIFEQSDPMMLNKARLVTPGEGYAGFLQGNVVDMLYFPIVKGARFPDWLPMVGGDEFEFFSPVFNLADVWVFMGVVILLIFQKRFFKDNGSIKPVL
ncbi:MAG: lipoprotein signal peptidase [Bacteroidota bacterium]